MKKTMSILLLLQLLLITPADVTAQNALPNSLVEYYNLKDTSLAEKMAEINVPLLEVKNAALLDSLKTYTSESILKRYGQHEDSNGIYFPVGFNTNPDDSMAMYIYITTLMNYYMYSYMITTLNSGLEPPSHRRYVVGGFWYGPYLVIVHAKRYIPTAEISRFFSETSDSLCLHIYKESPSRVFDDYSTTSKYFSVPFLNNNDYVSPVWPRHR